MGYFIKEFARGFLFVAIRASEPCQVSKVRFT